MRQGAMRGGGADHLLCGKEKPHCCGNRVIKSASSYTQKQPMPGRYLEGAHPNHTAKLRITNNGLFDLSVEFALKSKEEAAEGPEAIALEL
eukprot:1157805-Pelagomonas_calceolata.AAC.22